MIPLQINGIKKILEAPDKNPVIKILAANWLVEAFPKQAGEPLVRLGKTVNDGQLCATCLELLTGLKGDGLGDHAREILSNSKRANGLRQKAAVYLGAIQYHKGLDALIAATEDTDKAVAAGAVTGLGKFGGDQAIKALLALLANSKHHDFHQQIAQSLLATKDPRALQRVQEAAASGNGPALEALIRANSSKAAALVVPLLKHPDQGIRSSAAYGLGGLPLGNAAAKVADALAESADDALVNPLVTALIAAHWKDKKYARKLGVRLAKMTGFHYDLIRLLRLLSGNTMGPKDANEYYADSKGWTASLLEDGGPNASRDRAGGHLPEIGCTPK